MFGIRNHVGPVEEVTLNSLGQGMGNSSKSLRRKNYHICFIFIFFPLGSDG